MLAMLKRRAAVEVFDRARRPGERGDSLTRQLLLAVRFAGSCLRHRHLALYLALSGGKGQIFDALYLLAGKLCRRRVFVHHHSFAYIDSPTPISEALFYLARGQTHIVLSRGMGTALARRYGLAEGQVMVLSNAAFFEQTPENSGVAPDADTDAATPLRIGFLSNITFDKGFVEFFDVLTQLRSLNVKYRAHVAGPVAPEAREVFERLRASAADVEYLGAIYGAAKDRFYQQLDILMFPTKYANEADPLVIHEALRCGVYVIACKRGAIADTLENGAGLVVAQESFVSYAAASIRTLSRDRAKLLQGQRLAREQAERLREAGSIALDTVLNAIAFESGTV
jgi:glycosyltransferase involved in cell wall biosynthesis